MRTFSSPNFIRESHYFTLGTSRQVSRFPELNTLSRPVVVRWSPLTEAGAFQTVQLFSGSSTFSVSWPVYVTHWELRSIRIYKYRDSYVNPCRNRSHTMYQYSLDPNFFWDMWSVFINLHEYIKSSEIWTEFGVGNVDCIFFLNRLCNPHDL